jgi:hypothetical protein
VFAAQGVPRLMAGRPVQDSVGRTAVVCRNRDWIHGGMTIARRSQSDATSFGRDATCGVGETDPPHAGPVLLALSSLEN